MSIKGLKWGFGRQPTTATVSAARVSEVSLESPYQRNKRRWKRIWLMFEPGETPTFKSRVEGEGYRNTTEASSKAEINPRS